MLAAWAEDLTDAARTGRTAATLFRDETMEQVAACTLSWQGRLPLILGEPGTGKTNLLDGVAGLLAGREMKLLSVNMGSIMAGTLFESERETVLNSLLREARACDAILALEQAEWALIGVPRGHVLLREALGQGSASSPLGTTANHEQRFTPIRLVPGWRSCVLQSFLRQRYGARSGSVAPLHRCSPQH